MTQIVDRAKQLEASRKVAADIAELINNHVLHDDVSVYDVLMSLYINLLLSVRETARKEKPNTAVSDFDASILKSIENFAKEAVATYLVNIAIEDQQTKGVAQ